MSASERMAPLYCPYCGEEDIEPRGASAGAWLCRGCSRAFDVRFVGIEATI